MHWLPFSWKINQRLRDFVTRFLFSGRGNEFDITLSYDVNSIRQTNWKSDLVNTSMNRFVRERLQFSYGWFKNFKDVEKFLNFNLREGLWAGRGSYVRDEKRGWCQWSLINNCSHILAIIISHTIINTSNHVTTFWNWNFYYFSNQYNLTKTSRKWLPEIPTSMEFITILISRRFNGFLSWIKLD